MVKCSNVAFVNDPSWHWFQMQWIESWFICVHLPAKPSCLYLPPFLNTVSLQNQSPLQLFSASHNPTPKCFCFWRWCEEEGTVKWTTEENLHQPSSCASGPPGTKKASCTIELKMLRKLLAILSLLPPLSQTSAHSWKCCSKEFEEVENCAALQRRLSQLLSRACG